MSLLINQIKQTTQQVISAATPKNIAFAAASLTSGVVLGFLESNQPVPIAYAGMAMNELAIISTASQDTILPLASDPVGNISGRMGCLFALLGISFATAVKQAIEVRWWLQRIGG